MPWASALVAVSGLAAGYRVEPAARMSKINEGLPVASSDKGAVALYIKNSSSDTDARVANKLITRSHLTIITYKLALSKLSVSILEIEGAACRACKEGGGPSRSRTKLAGFLA